MKRALSGYALPLFSALVYLFLYVPIVILVLFSFNSSEVPYRWEHVTLRWYKQLFATPEVLLATENTLIIACAASLLSLAMGLTYVFLAKKFRLQPFIGLFYAGTALPEIIIAVGMLSFFSFFNVPLGITTLIAGHTVLGLGFVIPIIKAQYAEIDPILTEASLDLGASQRHTFFKIILPLLTPSLVAGGLLTFILSLDDFLISFFCSGVGAQTLSLYIFSLIRLGASPVINALSSVILVTSSLLVLLFCLLKIKSKVL